MLYAFDAEDAPGARLDVMGPNGMRGGDGPEDLLAAPVPTVRLWAPSSSSRPLAVAAADRNLSVALDKLAARARPLVGSEYEVLLALLAAVREAAPRRARVPKVGAAITRSGTPSMPAFASCLGLGDLEEALLGAVVRAVA